MAAVFRLNRLHRANICRRRRQRNTVNPIVDYTDEQCLRRYKFNKAGIEYVKNLVIDVLEHPTNLNNPIKPDIQICIFLRYAATGMFQLVNADLVKVSQPSVSRIITRIVNALCRPHIVHRFIQWPTQREDVIRKQQEFYAIAQMPQIVALIDCTHVRIKTPSENEAAFVNRRGNHSVNVQACCDANGYIMNLVARWPGSTNDSRILQQSELWEQYENGNHTGIVLADSGYPCRNWLFTPVLRPLTPQQRAYTRAHKSTRCGIEMLFGRVKKVFNLLHQEVRHVPIKVCKFTLACAGTYFNFCLFNNNK